MSIDCFTLLESNNGIKAFPEHMNSNFQENDTIVEDRFIFLP